MLRKTLQCKVKLIRYYIIYNTINIKIKLCKNVTSTKYFLKHFASIPIKLWNFWMFYERSKHPVFFFGYVLIMFNVFGYVLIMFNVLCFINVLKAFLFLVPNAPWTMYRCITFFVLTCNVLLTLLEELYS